MTIDEIAKYVYQVRYVDSYDRTMESFAQKLKEEGISTKELYEQFANGTLDDAVKKLNGLNIRREAAEAFSNKENKDFSDHTRKWLNDFLSEDVVARNYLFQRIIIEQKFRVWPSLPIVPLNIFQKTMAKKYAAYIIKDNRVIDLDLDIDVHKDYETGKYIIHSKEYNDFELKSQRDVFRCGRTRVFFLMMWGPHSYAKMPALLQSTTSVKPEIISPEVLV